MRLPTENVALISGDTVTPSSVRSYSTIFPLGGEGWHKIRLIFHHVVVIGTGADPNPLGGFLFLKNITLRTSKNEVIFSAPGMSFYHFSYLTNGVEPHYTAIAAGSATYDVVIDLPFVLPMLARKEDLMLDSGRYSMVELELQYGALTDLMRAPGTMTDAITVDIALTRSKGCFTATGKPVALPYIKHLTPFQAITKGYVDLESANDLCIFGLFAVTNDLVTWGCVGSAYEGTPVDLMDDISFQDNVLTYLRHLKLGVFQEERAQYSNNRAYSGMYPWIFTREGSIYNAYWTGAKSELKFIIGNGAFVAATTPQVDLVIFGMRQMRD